MLKGIVTVLWQYHNEKTAKYQVNKHKTRFSLIQTPRHQTSVVHVTIIVIIHRRICSKFTFCTFANIHDFRCLRRHVSAVARSCNYHAQAIGHIRHLLTMDLAQTLACSLILSRIDYCNAVLHGATSGTIHKLQRVQNNAARIVHQAPRRSHACLLYTSPSPRD